MTSVILTIIAATSAVAFSETTTNTTRIPAVPVGWLNAYPTVVQTGTKPELTWEITYPSVVKDYVTITGSGSIKLKTKLDINVRVLGSAITGARLVNGKYVSVDVPTEAAISYKGSSFSRIFYGNNKQVKPNTVVWQKLSVNTAVGDTIDFSGRFTYTANGQWSPQYTTKMTGKNIRCLVNGDTPPAVKGFGTQASLEQFVKPYLDSQGKVKIGPMDVIVFMELTHTDSHQTKEGYDLQDMVLLVTFTDNNVKNNKDKN